MENNTKPLYTTVETEWLEGISAKACAFDAIVNGTIKQSHLKMVCDSMAKAKSKHPIFADTLTENNINDCRNELFAIRHDNDLGEKCGCQVAEDILREEFLEAIEQHLQGNHRECQMEIADAIAVLFRIMEEED